MLFLIFVHMHLFDPLHLLLDVGSGILSIDMSLSEHLQFGPSASGSLAIRSKSKGHTAINEQFSRVKLFVNTEFGGCVVEGVLVVPVMPSFT
mmetsp:Transcript_14706/g.14139  ORF Transcript_14706/g.14139 Transcript_14706/m.14139 type:complete len:92 (+) Transcript_14706:344-619(+)